MEYIFEIILDFVLDIGIEASKSKRVPNWARYLLIAIISLFFIAVIGLIIFLGVVLLKDSVIAGSFLILFGVCLFIICIVKFVKTYLKVSDATDKK